MKLGPELILYLKNNKPLGRCLVIFGLLLLFSWTYFHLSGTPIILGDAKDYLAWSYDWRLSVFRAHHVPGWPAILWLFRQVTFGQIPDLPSVQILLFISSSLSIIYAYKIGIVLTSGSNREFVYIFAFFPFVSLSCSVLPIADSWGTLFLVVTIYLFLLKRWWIFCLLSAACVFFHKALWVYVGLINLVAIIKYGYPIWRAVLSAIPIGMYWIWGIGIMRHPFWLIRSNLSTDSVSKSSGFSFPLIEILNKSDGFRYGAKFVILLCLLFVILLLIAYFFPKRDYRMLAIIASSLILFLALNQEALWAGLRFSRVLCFPLALYLFQEKTSALPRLFNRYFYTGVLLLVLSQVSYVIFMVEVYYRHAV